MHPLLQLLTDLYGQLLDAQKRASALEQALAEAKTPEGDDDKP